MTTSHTDEYNEGYAAFHAGLNGEDNPYAFGRMAFGLGSWARDWNEGWDDAEKESAR